MPRPHHPKKEIDKALGVAAANGLSVVAIASGHRWGFVACDRCNARRLSVWSAPRVPEHMAEQIVKYVARHQHPPEGSSDGERR